MHTHPHTLRPTSGRHTPMASISSIFIPQDLMLSSSTHLWWNMQTHTPTSAPLLRIQPVVAPLNLNVLGGPGMSSKLYPYLRSRLVLGLYSCGVVQDREKGSSKVVHCWQSGAIASVKIWFGSRLITLEQDRPETLTVQNMVPKPKLFSLPQKSIVWWAFGVLSGGQQTGISFTVTWTRMSSWLRPIQQVFRLIEHIGLCVVGPKSPEILFLFVGCNDF